MTTKCYVFDIDGTIANNGHRTHHLLKNPKDWDAYHALVSRDSPIHHICNLVTILERKAPIIFCTGRPKRQQNETLIWIRFNIFRENYTPQLYLYMRDDGDHRPDEIVKREMLDQMRGDGFEPIMVFDDRNSVVKMWREAGIPCAQVAEGDF